METTLSRGNDAARRSIVGSSRPRRRPSLEKKDPLPSLDKKTPAAGKRQLAREGKEQPAEDEVSCGRPGKKPAASRLQTRRRWGQRAAPGAGRHAGQADVSGCTAAGAPARKSALCRELAPGSSRAAPAACRRADGSGRVRVGQHSTKETERPVGEKKYVAKSVGPTDVDSV